MLKDTKVDSSNLDLAHLSRVMSGMSGSDIKEACRDAAMIPVREMIHRQRQTGQRMQQIVAGDIRGLRTMDFFQPAPGNKITKQVEAEREAEDWSTESSSAGADDMQEAVEQITGTGVNTAESRS